MSTINKIKVGLFGFGNVGQGFYNIINEKENTHFEIAKICVKNKNKPRSVTDGILSYDKSDILSNSDIDLVVEAIDDYAASYTIVREALKLGKHVITANKKMLASHLDELHDLANANKVTLLYEATACGSIPIIRNIEDYYSTLNIKSLSGIYNGTSNYILTKIFNENASYADALLDAQKKGFAETDPTNDVEGYDAKYKAIIIAYHAFGIAVQPEEVFNLGINTLGQDEINFAQNNHKVIKLTPIIKEEAGKLNILVLPNYINKEDIVANVLNENNCVTINAEFISEQILIGKGAGSYPTGTAVYNDAVALLDGYAYKRTKLNKQSALAFTNDSVIKVLVKQPLASKSNPLKFETVLNEIETASNKITIGLINIQELITNKKFIQDNALFVSLIGDNYTFNIEAFRSRKQETVKELVS